MQGLRGAYDHNIDFLIKSPIKNKMQIFSSKIQKLLKMRFTYTFDGFSFFKKSIRAMTLY